MMLGLTSLVPLLSLAASGWAQDQYKGKYNTPDNLPAQIDSNGGQTGYNDCVSRYGSSNQHAKCVNFFINSVADFCLWGPPSTGSIGDDEAEVVSYCLKEGYGTRLIPEGTITGAHFLKTPNFVQVTGTGDLTKIKIQDGDEGGELDPHGATGSGNPIGGLVFSTARTGSYERLAEWTSFVAYDSFCARACFGESNDSRQYCQHTYDEMGCYWNEPANYDSGVFEECDGDSGEKPGIYTVNGSASTFHQSQDKTTPSAHPAPSSSNCRNHASVTNGPTKHSISN